MPALKEKPKPATSDRRPRVDDRPAVRALASQRAKAEQIITEAAKELDGGGGESAEGAKHGRLVGAMVDFFTGKKPAPEVAPAPDRGTAGERLAAASEALAQIDLKIQQARLRIARDYAGDWEPDLAAINARIVRALVELKKADDERLGHVTGMMAAGILSNPTHAQYVAGAAAQRVLQALRNCRVSELIETNAHLLKD
jgi:hypothetical protein